MFLLAALLFLAEIIPFALYGDAITRDNSPFFIYLLNQFYLLVVSFLFFGWFWTHGGQTLGMKTWRLLLQTSDGHNLNWSQAGLRFVAAILSWIVLGLGFIWSLIDKDKRTWHDIISATVLIQLEKNK
ncbi:MAG: RDD family protein [Gammaproteobacteria bacterium]|nr:MAG: RDD family protein [Gammaproteobacteria bacterium]